MMHSKFASRKRPLLTRYTVDRKQHLHLRSYLNGDYSSWRDRDWAAILPNHLLAVGVQTKSQPRWFIAGSYLSSQVSCIHHTSFSFDTLTKAVLFQHPSMLVIGLCSYYSDFTVLWLWMQRRSERHESKSNCPYLLHEWVRMLLSNGHLVSRFENLNHFGNFPNQWKPLQTLTISLILSTGGRPYNQCSKSQSMFRLLFGQLLYWR